MAILKFNKAELVNRSYSLKREILSVNKTGAYLNTSIVSCNTRRYHGLLAVPVDAYEGRKYLLLSSLDETLEVNGKYFNLGIHCYGDVYEPRGHKYVVDFSADGVPQITYKVGQIIFRKSYVLSPRKDQMLIRFELLEAPSPVVLHLKPFLAFREIHALTEENPAACCEGYQVDGGMSFRMYEGFPNLYLQLSNPETSYEPHPSWYKGVTYSDEARRGYACREDLMVPGHFEVPMKAGESVVFSASTSEEKPSGLKRRFSTDEKAAGTISSYHDQLVRCADLLIQDRNGVKQINAGLSWLYTGLLRETLQALPGLTLYATGDKALFEEILDNLIKAESERLYHRTTQVEAPLLLPIVLERYIDFGADPAAVWKKYGEVVRGIVDSYLPGKRNEVAMHPSGLLWAQMDRVALSWMNAYINGSPVTERPGYQVETNAFWYDAVSFAVEMEKQYVGVDDFVARWVGLIPMIKENFQKTFWNPAAGYLADYVNDGGQNMARRPNQLMALWVKHSPVDDHMAAGVLRVIDNELLTQRGIRTLSPRDPLYMGVYEGTQIERDLAYHNGCTRPFLLEQYVSVSFRMKGASFWKKAEWLIESFADDLSRHGVGHFSELYDGDPPQEAHGAISSALSTAALLVVDHMMKKYKDE